MLPPSFFLFPSPGGGLNSNDSFELKFFGPRPAKHAASPPLLPAAVPPPPLPRGAFQSSQLHPSFSLLSAPNSAFFPGPPPREWNATLSLTPPSLFGKFSETTRSLHLRFPQTPRDCRVALSSSPWLLSGSRLDTRSFGLLHRFHPGSHIQSFPAHAPPSIGCGVLITGSLPWAFSFSQWLMLL